MKVGIVGDLHLPFTHPLYLQFCLDTFSEWNVDHIHFAGDVVDGHALSFWDADPDLHSAKKEAELASEQLEVWRNSIDKATVSIGNHDALHFRKAFKAGIPTLYIRDYAEVWKTPNWTWEPSTVVDSVVYEHGSGTSGKDAAMNRALAKRKSTVIGHVHSFAGVKWHMSDYDRIFGLNAGCGIDVDAAAFAYNKPYPNRPALGCGIVLDGVHAFFEVMPCCPGEVYHRSKA